MNKEITICQVLILGLSCPAFAKAGIATGEFEFLLSIAGFLLLVTGIVAAIEYLLKNGRDLFNKFKACLKKNILMHKNPA